MVEPAVLIITNERDVAADMVVRELRAAGVPYVRVNAERLESRSFAWDGTEVRIQGADVSGVRSVWLRQPTWPAFPTAAPEERDVLQNQWRAAVRGLGVLPARWMNRLDAGLAAESKMLQLSTARRVGMTVPDTLVTNDMDDAREFLGRHGGRAVVKGLDAPYIENAERPRFMFTTVIDEASLPSRRIDGVPMIFQQLIEPKVDLRITVVGDEAFATRIDGPGDEVDWRRAGADAVLSPVEIDSELGGQCQRFLERLGLTYGAFDFVLADHSPLFLECNQNGEWGWLERGTGAPIARAVAGVLAAP